MRSLNFKRLYVAHLAVNGNIYEARFINGGFIVITFVLEANAVVNYHDELSLEPLPDVLLALTAFLRSTLTHSEPDS